ncbi:electron transport complex subunit RsxG [Shimwellia blattae]|uniref:Ion-translocating oxidoreductase complex subunit G n=1 Tax=Shimwellia blattae (strain ATCC 29907 / DSM 4481 / JCM 1650 / NBRC 105725 / CDC 9005-74) TaxID=630626 RepID=I2BA07_SHIBC|nr:electron transport complex subunit RsxG [Shimwellia blattae]AFJ47361.1 electron transport complex protein RnfG [Shimwellia blattae DSM 4481 = NBRC 105725]GAB80446.1 electron transport complex protein RnfG [Shimwellia blattae DSM 4481 = NBRC 105725]VDY64856.1 electron transport complex protein RnfG [Shimwellia blattae]VEC22990.1 electron transport complex protein RnfG [Shimwellia blattae]
MLQTLRKHGVTLAVFAALTTGLTAVVNALTQGTIARQNADQQQALFNEVYPASLYDNSPRQHCLVVSDPALGRGPHRLWLATRQDKPVGVIIEATAPDGYSGAIQLLIGADLQGTIQGVRVTEHHETPGLGDKIELRVSDWIRHFAGQHIQGPDDKRWAVKKDGGEFDQFTGATITPRAVVNAVKRAGLFARHLPGQLDQLPACTGEIQ